MAKENLEPWTGTQRSLPILLGLVWMAVGLAVSTLSLLEIASRWQYLAWGIAIMLGGLFILYLRLAVLPGVRKL